MGVWNGTQAKQSVYARDGCYNQCYKKGRLVCKSTSHSCPALHRRTGLLAPSDNHPLADGHQFLSDLTSNHGAIFQSIPLLYVYAGTRLVYGNTRQAMCMLHTKQQKPVCVYLALRMFVEFFNS